MGRRLAWIVGIALVAACGVPLVAAQQMPPPPQEADQDNPPPPPQPEPQKQPKEEEEAPLPQVPLPPRTVSTPAPTDSAPRAQRPAAPIPPVEPLDEPPPPSTLPADTMPALPGLGHPAPRDDEAIRTQLGTIPAPSRGPAPGGGEPDGLMLPADRLPLGRQTVGLTVDVQAPAVVNKNKVTSLKVVVRNVGTSDAMGVMVRDQLPEGLQYVSSQPEAQASGQLLIWRLGTLPANTEKVLTVRVRPTQVGSFDHAATVVAAAGGKSRTTVQEPKLKVEQTVKARQVLKGNQVEFRIAVSNPGTGPARHVVVRAKLSEGLRHEQGKHVEQVIPLIRAAEQRVELDPLVVEAVAGGEQSCVVTVESPDVEQPDSPDMAAESKIEVVEPKLELKIVGPKQRYTDTVASYKIIVQNPGTAAVREVQVAAILPVGGTLIPSQADTGFDRQYDRFKRRLIWTIPQIDQKGEVTLGFDVRLGGIGLYQVTAEARARAPYSLASKPQVSSTDVTGMADVDFQVSERKRVIDEGQKTEFEIRIKNHGSKEALNLLISAKLSENLTLEHTSGLETVLDPNKMANRDKTTGEIVFPPIPRLAPGAELVLSLQVTANAPGVATCTVSLLHDDLDNSRLSRSAVTRVTAANGTVAR